jgi:hypothetical protein
MTTTNMAEALYLIQQGNRITGLSVIADWPYGIDACAFEFAGDQADEDHAYYLSHNMEFLDLTALPLLFGAIEDVLEIPLLSERARL